jgi:hypothetical protein
MTLQKLILAFDLVLSRVFVAHTCFAVARNYCRPHLSSSTVINNALKYISLSQGMKDQIPYLLELGVDAGELEIHKRSGINPMLLQPKR